MRRASLTDFGRCAVVEAAVGPVVVVMDVGGDHLPGLVENLEVVSPDTALLEVAKPRLDERLALGVAVAGGVILFTGWLWLDPAASIVLAIAILAGTWSLMRKSLNLMLDAVPEGIDPAEVKAFLCALPRVVEVHDLHIWAMSTTETALTAHLVMPGNSCEPTFIAGACKELHEKFDIDHATLQIDPEEASAPCALAPDGVV